MTKIEWCDETINPIIGCSATPISPACRNCYAARMAYRLGHGGLAPEGPTRKAYKAVVDPDTRYWNGQTRFVAGTFGGPERRKKPTTYFVGSMADMALSEYRTLSYISDRLEEMSHHTFLILTKRPGPWIALFAALENVWIGASASDQADLDRVAPDLLRYGGPRTFLSLEPLLGPITLGPDGNFLLEGKGCIRAVIVGGQTGPGAAPMHPDWARSLRDDCAKAGVPFFFKQWGEFRPPETPEEWEAFKNGKGFHGTLVLNGTFEDPHGRAQVRVGKSSAGRLLDGRTHDDLPWPVRNLNRKDA